MSKQLKWWGWGAEDKVADVSKAPAFWDFVEKNAGGSRTTSLSNTIDFEQLELSLVKEAPEFIQALSHYLKPEQISSDKLARLQHTYGKSYRDLLRVRTQRLHYAPDYVIFPNNHAEVEKIIQLADHYNVVVIPFGGGTNIVGAVERLANEERTVISLDMKYMSRLLELDPISMTATFEAGVLGPDLEEQLTQHGFALGHYPDSFEFSTLGGWLATRSAGMQSDRYGTIADMALAMKCVTPKGTIVTKAVPNASVGPDINHIIMGSEGLYGVITEATMKIHPLPPVRAFRGILFHNFAEGAQAIYQCVTENCLPHAIRFLDSRETQLSFSFKQPSKGAKKLIEKGVRAYLTKVAKFNFSECCLMILAFEGTEAEVTEKRSKVMSICRKHGGFDLGAEPGNHWYARKYDYPYLRDLIMDHGCMADVVETSIGWSKVVSFYEQVKQTIYTELAASNEQTAVNKLITQSDYPGYVGCHISHTYQNGACLYFTYAAPQRLGNELEQYLAVKKAATDAIIKYGGALSHHHSVGYEHSSWLKYEITEHGIKTLEGIKDTLDPRNILNPGKLMPNDKVK